jgi:hypothetical protein
VYVDTTRYACRNAPTAVHSMTHATVCLETQVALSPMQEDDTLQYTCRTLSPFGSVTRSSFQTSTLSIDVPLTGRGQNQDTWLQNVLVKIDADVLDVKVAASFTTQELVQVVVNYNITSCVVCHARNRSPSTFKTSVSRPPRVGSRNTSERQST